jgi:chromosome segregation ATPase
MSHELALEEIRKQVKVYKAFAEAENALIALASLEQHTKELSASKKELEASLTKLKVDIRSKQDKSLELDDKLSAKEIFVRDQIKEYEAQKLAELDNTYGLRKQEKEKEVTILNEECDKLRLHIKNHDIYLKTKQKEIADLESRISSAKEQIQRLLNGNA